jgi:hypothetical protein
VVEVKAFITTGQGMHHLLDVRHQIGRDTNWMLAELSTRVSSNRVEIPASLVFHDAGQG